MKKLAAAAAVVLAALFLFAGCSSQITVTLYSGWLSNTANNYERDFYESLDYKVSFTPAETSNWISYSVDGTNSSYNVTTKAIGTYTCPENAVTYTNVYQLTITIQTAASFSFSADGAEQTVAFGGENDENPDNDPRKIFRRTTPTAWCIRHGSARSTRLRTPRKTKVSPNPPCALSAACRKCARTGCNRRGSCT